MVIVEEEEEEETSSSGSLLKKVQMSMVPRFSPPAFPLFTGEGQTAQLNVSSARRRTQRIAPNARCVVVTQLPHCRGPRTLRGCRRGNVDENGSLLEGRGDAVEGVSAGGRWCCLVWGRDGSQI